MHRNREFPLLPRNEQEIILTSQMEAGGVEMSRTKKEVIKIIEQISEEASVADIMAGMYLTVASAPASNPGCWTIKTDTRKEHDI